MIQEIAFTCYPVTDMARTRSFYESTLGLTPAMVHETPDGNVLLIHKRNPAEAEAPAS